MRVSYHQYTLVGKGDFSDRDGALLRFHFPDGSMGYADCHPWVELGDLPLKGQLDALQNGKITPLTQRSLHFASLDADARKENRNLFDFLRVPDSHWLISSLDEDLSQPIELGFTHLKLKIRPETSPQRVKEKLQSLPEQCRIRFDCNNSFSYESFTAFFELLSDIYSRVEFIEDPYPYDELQWNATYRRFQISLACDKESAMARESQGSHQISVVKPAAQDEELFLQDSVHNRKWVVTSYLDHPLGQVAAAYTAAYMSREVPGRMGTCGLLSHHVYETNLFSACFRHHGKAFVPPEGVGFGFDKQLEEISWSQLR